MTTIFMIKHWRMTKELPEHSCFTKFGEGELLDNQITVVSIKMDLTWGKWYFPENRQDFMGFDFKLTLVFFHTPLAYIWLSTSEH